MWVFLGEWVGMGLLALAGWWWVHHELNRRER